MRRVALRPIDQLNAEWTVTGRTEEAREALRRLSAAEPDVAETGAQDLGGLVASLHGARGAHQRERSARVLAAMLRSQDVHPLVPRAILQAIVPGLVSVGRRLQWGTGGEWRDGGAFFADLVSTAWEVIRAWAGQDRGYAVLDLLSAIRCRARRQLLAHRTEHGRTHVGLEPASEGGTPSSGTTALDELAHLLDAMAGQGIARRDAAVLYGNRVLGLTLSELSEVTGLSRHRLDGSRRRAARALCA